MRTAEPSSRSCLRPIEVVVLLLVCAVAFAMIMPALQSARTLRGVVSCRNNVRQIGGALQIYHDVYKTLPPLSYGPTGPTNSSANAVSGRPQPQLSAHVALLQFFESEWLTHPIPFASTPTDFRGIQWSTSKANVKGDPDSLDPDNSWWEKLGSTHRFEQRVLLCPTGPRTSSTGFGRNSYHFCTGTVGTYTEEMVGGAVDVATDNNQWGRRNDGVFTAEIGRRYSDILDGQANTVAAAEVAMFNPAARRKIGNVARVRLNSPEKHGTNLAQIIARSSHSRDYLDCTATHGGGDTYLPGVDTFWAAGGENSDTVGGRWHDGAVYYTGMTTTFPPNGPSCTDAIRGTAAFITASSFHPERGANFLMVDGSTRFITEEVDRVVLWELGTIAGGESKQLDE